MDLGISSNLLGILQLHGYLLIFILMLMEGPIITYLAAYSASLGFFNIYIVFFLSALGSIFQDIILFSIGRLSRGKIIERMIGFFGVTQPRIIKIEKGLKKHLGKSITLIKITPGFPIPGLMLAGFMRVPYRSFLWVSAAFNLIAVTVFTLLGYYSGIASINILKYLKIEGFIVLPLIILTIVAFILIKFLRTRLEKSV